MGGGEVAGSRRQGVACGVQRAGVLGVGSVGVGRDRR